MGLTRFLGRVAFSLIFVLGGMKLLNFQQVAAHTASGFAACGLSGALLKVGIDIAPLVPALLAVAIALEVVGGLLIIVGMEQLGAALLLAFLVAITPVMHWDLSNQGEQVAFFKNLALAGGCLYMLGQSSHKKSKTH